MLGDEGMSGALDFLHRPGLAEALRRLGEGEADTLVCYRLDRLARELVVQEQTLAAAWATGATVLSCSAAERVWCQPDDDDDPARTLVRQVLAAVGQYERRMIRLRLRSGRRRAIAQGRWGGGPTPFGWAPGETGELVPEAEEAEVVRQMEAHRDAGLSLNSVAELLNETETWNRGRPWTAAAVRRALTSATRLQGGSHAAAS
jgi:DNA invertase Pin-like site-specific DNA recombinase